MAAWPLNIYELSRCRRCRHRGPNLEPRTREQSTEETGKESRPQGNGAGAGGDGGTRGEKKVEEAPRTLREGDVAGERGRRMRFRRPRKGTACGYRRPVGFRFRCFRDAILQDIIAWPGCATTAAKGNGSHSVALRSSIALLRARSWSTCFDSVPDIVRCFVDAGVF